MQTLQFILINLKYMTNIFVPVHMRKTFIHKTALVTRQTYTQKKNHAMSIHGQILFIPQGYFFPVFLSIQSFVHVNMYQRKELRIQKYRNVKYIIN